MRRLSPGIILPAVRIMTSPDTISLVGISMLLPLRTTVDFVCTIDKSFFTASAAPYSCQNPRPPLIKTITRIIAVWTESDNRKDNPAAKRRRRLTPKRLRNRSSITFHVSPDADDRRLLVRFVTPHLPESPNSSLYFHRC